MARMPAPPGPPPRHYRPPGTSPPPVPWSTGPLGGRPSPQPVQAPGGATAGAVAAVALVTLLLGAVIGFFLGRATDDGSGERSLPPLTSPSTETSRPPGNTIAPNPVDPSAPPSTDLDPSTIGGLGDPIPVGQSYILGLYEVEVRSADLDAAEELARHAPGNPAPPQGRRHVTVEIVVRYTDEGMGNPSAIPFFVSDGTGQWNDFEASCGVVPRSILDAGLIEQGTDAVGNTCFTVPEDVVGDLVFGTEGFAGPIYFALPD